MSRITIDLRCTACPATFYKTMERELATYEARWHCATCGTASSLMRVPSAPRVMKEALPDGNGRFADLKAASKIAMDSYNLPESQRGEHNKEIQKLNGIK